MTPLHYPTDEEIVEAYQKLKASQRRVLFDPWNGIPSNPLVTLAKEQTEAMDAGRISRRDSPEEHRCAVCDRLLRVEQVRRGICAGCATDEDY